MEILIIILILIGSMLLFSIKEIEKLERDHKELKSIIDDFLYYYPDASELLGNQGNHMIKIIERMKQIND